ncbi:TPA: transcriptional regulator [Serratia fonticola]|uniref:winged helix-turn-helix domain-containing protein n=1 Tax=Serratia fonticola TaxID=47917 RepID=UPI001376ABC8|nr:winged helix-turn-helix domain-containing protein [Serratia fonticola]NBJ37182.1 hypothetical protein [Serratia fonticola]
MASNSNDHYYLIGDCIEFRPEDNLLHSRFNGEKITLFVAASRCLQLLLNQQGKLVSQKDLIETGWQKNGMGVSNNTFYQNILILRKGFKLAGYEQTVIKTVPRQGLTIPSAVHVEKITPCKEREYSKVESITEENKPSTPCHVKKNLSQSLWTWVLGFSLCAGFIMLVVWFIAGKSNFFSSFNYIGKIERCSVYLNGPQTTLRSYMQFIAKNNFACKAQGFVYFSTYPLVPRASAISCDRPIATGIENSCTSEYYLEWQPNE